MTMHVYMEECAYAGQRWDISSLPLFSLLPLTSAVGDKIPAQAGPRPIWAGGKDGTMSARAGGVNVCIYLDVWVP